MFNFLRKLSIFSSMSFSHSTRVKALNQILAFDTSFISLTLSFEDTLDMYSVHSYADPIPVGYGSSCGKPRIYLNCPEDYKFYMPDEQNRFCDTPAHSQLILLDADQSILHMSPRGHVPVNLHWFILYAEHNEAKLKTLLTYLKDLESRKITVDTRYFNSSESRTLSRTIAQVQDHLSLYKTTHPELFI